MLEGRNQKEKSIQPWSLRKGDLEHNKLKKIKNNEKVEKFKWRNKLETEKSK